MDEAETWEHYLETEAAFRAPDQLDEIVELDAMISVMDGQRVGRIDALRRDAYRLAARDGITGRELVDRSVRLELAAAMGVTEHAAGMLMARGEALVHRYPTALDSLSRGRMSTRHSEVLVSLLDAVGPVVRAALVDQAVELAETEPVGVFRRRLQALIEQAQQSTLVERHETALAARRVFYEPGNDGMAWLGIYGPAVELKAGFERLTKMGKAIRQTVSGRTVDQRTLDERTLEESAQDESAQAGSAPGGRTTDERTAGGRTTDARTLDQVRADIFGDLLIEGVVQLHPEAARGIRAEVVVTVPVLSLLDDDYAAAGEPARVEGVGPIPIGKARELAGGSKEWMRVLTHPETGVILSVGRTKYRPPKALRRLVKWRAGHCVAPGCLIPADRCDIDHTVAWDDGGETELSNLNPLCRGHHTLKHGSDWEIEQQPDSGGATRWTSPLGRAYSVAPERTLPTFTVEPAPF